MLKSILWEGFFILPWGPSYETLPRRQDSRATRARRTSRLVLSRLSRSWCFTGSALWLDVQQPQQSWWMYLQPRGNTASVTQCALLTISKTHKNNMTLHVTRAGTFVTSQPEQNGRQQPAVQNSRHEMWRAAAELKTEGGGAGQDPALLSANHQTQHLLVAHWGHVGEFGIAVSHMLFSIWPQGKYFFSFKRLLCCDAVTLFILTENHIWVTIGHQRKLKWSINEMYL